MKHHLALVAGTALLIVGCGNAATLPVRDTSLAEELRNPLYAEYYYDDLTDLMVTLALQEDPILTDPGTRAVLDRTRLRSLEHANIATKSQLQGRKGAFVSDRTLVQGDALLLNDVLYVGPTFDAAPGPSLTMYLTTVNDPREGPFPDPSAIRLGTVKNPYGAQAFTVPTTPTESGSVLRTAVLWDEDLGILYGFAQLMRPGQ